jgi:hypothetical protein
MTQLYNVLSSLTLSDRKLLDKTMKDFRSLLNGDDSLESRSRRLEPETPAKREACRAFLAP